MNYEPLMMICGGTPHEKIMIPCHDSEGEVLSVSSRPRKEVCTKSVANNNKTYLQLHTMWHVHIGATLGYKNMNLYDFVCSRGG